MKKQWFKEVVWPYVLVVVGSLMFAAGDVLFVNPYHLAPGGTYGLANVFNTLWPWKISLYAICMDVPLLIIGTLILGPKFGFKTVLSTVLIFAATFVIESWWGYAPVIHDGEILQASVSGISMVEIQGGGWFIPDYFLNSVVAAIVYGVGLGLVFRSGATSGGSDIISMIIQKYTHMSIGTLVMLVDGFITLTTFIAFHDIKLPIYSLLLIVVEGKIIDLVVEGRKNFHTAFVVTDNVQGVRDFIINDLNRGGTCLTGEGLYQGAERKIIYVTLSRTDLVKFKSKIHSIDPKAFINIVDSNEILGEGFHPIPLE